MSSYVEMGQAVALIKGLSKAFITSEAEAAQTAAESAEAAQEAAASVQYPVSYGVAQTLTSAQKAQAQENIGVEIATTAETLTYVTGGV